MWPRRGVASGAFTMEISRLVVFSSSGRSRWATRSSWADSDGSVYWNRSASASTCANTASSRCCQATTAAPTASIASATSAATALRMIQTVRRRSLTEAARNSTALRVSKVSPADRAQPCACSSREPRYSSDESRFEPSQARPSSSSR